VVDEGREAETAGLARHQVGKRAEGEAVEERERAVRQRGEGRGGRGLGAGVGLGEAVRQGDDVDVPREGAQALDQAAVIAVAPRGRREVAGDDEGDAGQRLAS
jgi:hypothetical protein